MSMRELLLRTGKKHFTQGYLTISTEMTSRTAISLTTLLDVCTV